MNIYQEPDRKIVIREYKKLTTEVENFKYDIVINNNGTLEDLAAHAMNFIKTEGIKGNDY